MDIGIVRIDILKSVFQMHAAIEDGSPVFRKKLTRDQFLPFLAELPACLVVMEARGGAHHWGRRIKELGRECRLVPPVYVKTFVKRPKNDSNDAAVIAEAAQRLAMCFVAVKPEEAQADAVLFRYVNSRVRMGDLNDEMLRFIEFREERNGEPLRELELDSRLTTLPISDGSTQRGLTS